MSTRIISCDIDGILNNYPQCWLDYLALETGTLYYSVDEAKRKEALYKTIKDKYRSSSYKENLPINQTGVELLKKIHEQNYSIIIATSRPLNESAYPQLRKLTMNWLQKNGIPFDELIFKNTNADFIDRFKYIDFHIEDDLKYAEIISNKGIKTFLYNQQMNDKVLSQSDNLIIVSNLLDIMEYIR